MEYQAIVFALIGVLGIGAQWVAWKTGWPAIALMLLAGVLAGPVLGLIDPEHTFGALLEPAISLAVAVILFEGGLSLRLRELRKTEGAVIRLTLIGVPVGWVLGAAAGHYLAGLAWPVAVLFGGILVVTGPTVVIPLLRQSNIESRPRTILKWEGIVNDPVGALCAVLTYEYLRRSLEGGTLASVAVSLLVASLVAGGIGYAAARLMSWALPRGHIPEYLKSPVLLVMVIGVFVASNLIQQEAGLVAVTVMGVAMANMQIDSLRELRAFKENVTVILVSGVFVLLSASLDLELVRQFEWRFIAFLAGVLFLVRPIAVMASLAFSRVPWRERALIAWIAPRGIVLVAISGLFALRLDQIGYSGGTVLIALSFSVVAATIVVHGFTIGPLARVLKLTGPKKSGLILAGGTSFSFGLAEQLNELEVPVLIADTSWQRLARARQAGIPTYHGEILAEATDEHIDMSHYQALAAVTENEAYNTLICNEFAPEFGRDNVYQLGDAGNGGSLALPADLRGRALFASGLGVEQISRHVRAGWTFRKTPITDVYGLAEMREELPEESELLMVLRSAGTIKFFTHASQPEPEPGDTVISYVPPHRDAHASKAAA
ncbi:sodium:proton antiporter [Novosphingobium sp. ZN18A2]|uniref:cation:proton antiporter n=1 Tax=Novosphingobium sp. ZN18A2 TaxID=3079861 RepID=UPI0030D59B5A